MLNIKIIALKFSYYFVPINIARNPLTCCGLPVALVNANIPALPMLLQSPPRTKNVPCVYG